MKKAGFIIGATAAGLLAVTPLAFADDNPGSDGVDKDSTSAVSGGNGNNASLPITGCNNNVNAVGGQVTDLGLAGLGGAQNSDACGQNSATGDNGN